MTINKLVINLNFPQKTTIILVDFGNRRNLMANRIHASTSARKNPAGKAAASPVAPDAGVGRRLREIRMARGLSIRTLAKLSGLNVNTLSLIENGRTSPSVSTLQQLAQGLQVPVTEFFEKDRGSKRLVFQRHGSRTQMAFEHGAMEDLAPGMPRFGAEPIIVTIEPDADSGRKPIVHTGREFVYCLEGRVSYTVDNRKYSLETGDSLVFEAYLPHYWKNADAKPARLLLVLCPMDQRDSPTERHFATQP